MKPLSVLNALHFGVLTTVRAASGPDQKPFLPHESADRAEVHLPSGTIFGSVVAGVEVFRGIPYAEPPEEDLRLKPPVRLEADLGSFDATGPGPSCPQFGSFLPAKTPVLGELYRRYAGYKRLSALLGDVVFTLLRRLTLSFATEANSDVPAWSYMSSYLHDATGLSGNDRGTFHATDVFYGMFGLSNIVDLEGLPKLPYPIAQTRKYYLNFLYNLDPNQGLPVAKHWPTWEERNPKLLRFNVLNIAEINDDFRQKSYDFIKENRADLYA